MTADKKNHSIQDLLNRNVEEVIIREELENKLKKGRKLRVKLGIDPTGPKVHLGYAAVLWKLRAFQELGHKIVLIIGDFTAQIGDTSDKNAERPMLTAAQVKANEKTYLEQLGKILDPKKTEFHYNSSWFGELGLDEFIKLASSYTIGQMIERDNFAKRLKSGKPVGLHETLYPVLQAYDSVMVKADLELGGTDQLFNMMAGRSLQKAFDQEPQSVMTMQLLEGIDGRKMSKSWGNCIYITDQPLEMYGKVMAIRDELIPVYFKMCTDVALEVIEQIEKNMAQGDNPRDTKASLSRAIVARYWGDQAAVEAEEAWNRQFRSGEKPMHIEEVVIKKQRPHNLVDFISEHFHLSKSEARRVINQNGVRINDEVSTESEIELIDDMVIQVGKRRFKKIKLEK